MGASGKLTVLCLSVYLYYCVISYIILPGLLPVITALAHQSTALLTCLCYRLQYMKYFPLFSQKCSKELSRGHLGKNNLPEIAIIFLSISLNMCFGCSKESSHRDSSFGYPQHMFRLRNNKNNFQSGGLIVSLSCLLWLRNKVDKYYYDF